MSKNKVVLIQVVGPAMSGKTTTAAMIGRMLLNLGKRPVLSEEAQAISTDEVELNGRLKDFLDAHEFVIEEVQTPRVETKPVKEDENV